MSGERRDEFAVGISRPTRAGGERPHRDMPTLRQLAAGGGRTFEDFATLRAAVLAQVDALRTIWVDANRPSSLEGVAPVNSDRQASLLETLLEETGRLFAGATVEIGVLGEVKKGKSTLVNTLAGRRVSAVAAPPETAVPVSIESSDSENATLHIEGGRTEAVRLPDALEAMTQRGQRKRAKEQKPPVVRVTVQLPIDRIPRGVRIVDTPGLNDPSLVAEYDKFALAELDRVSAAVFVFCYPNGPGAQEIELLRSLGRHGVDKVFLLYNFWPDAWASRRDREALVEYLKEVVKSASAAGKSVNVDDIRVYPVNLQMAWKATEDGDVKKLAESGFSQFQADVERFLATGVLTRSSRGAASRLLGAAESISETLAARRRLLEDPAAVRELKAAHERSISTSERELEQIKNDARRALQAIGGELKDMARAPFDAAISRAAGTRARTELQAIAPRLGLDLGAANSRISTKWSTEFVRVTNECRERLAKVLKYEGWPGVGAPSSMAAIAVDFLDETIVQDEKLGVDRSTDGAVVGGVIGAIIAATGAGLSIATGGLAAPFVGLIFGGLLGGAGGSLMSEQGTGSAASAAEYSRLLEKLTSARDRALRSIDDVVVKGSNDISRSLDQTRSQVLGGVQDEVRRIDALLNDSAGRDRALGEIDAIEKRLRQVVG